MSPEECTRHIKKLAKDAGFDHCGIARAEAIGRGDYLRNWLEAGKAGSMAYLRRYLDERIDPRRLLDGARSVIVVALLYHQSQPDSAPDDGGPQGRVAMYAWGGDYHKIVKKKLHSLADRLRADLPGPFDARACVDTAPLLERELAAAAGIGWIGKNTMVVSRELGSYFFLGALVTTLDLPPDKPAEDHCGTCTRCLEACPTSALIAPYRMDASRCVSYLTIEHRGEIPAQFHEPMGLWIFGCDVCQEVCPFNRKAPHTNEPRFALRPPGPRPDLNDMLTWTEDDYRDHLRGSAMKRATLPMLKCNAAIALRNSGA
jgi:epoxyqueuosine reductase